MSKQTMKGLMLGLALWCAVILLCALPASAEVEVSVTVDGQEYVQGGDVSSTGVDLSDVSVSTYYRAGEGYLLFTPASTGASSAVLVMKNATVGGLDAFGIRYDADLKVILHGENVITSGDAADVESMGLAVYGLLQIEGEGSLTVHAGGATGLYHGSTAIFAQNGLTVDENVTVTANAGTAQFSVAVQSEGQITVNGTLFANAGSSEVHAPYGSAGIAVYADSLTLGDEGELTLFSGEGDACYPFQSDEAIEASQQITLLRDGNSYAWGGDASNLLKLSEFPTVPTYYTADCENRGLGYAIFIPEADGSAARLLLYHARIGANTNVGLYIQCKDTLEIVYYWENHIETPDAPTDTERAISNAAIVANGKLTLTAGDTQATLRISAGEGYSSYGIFARELTVSGGLLTVSASDGVKESYGLYVRGSLAILDGARVTAEAGSAADSVGVTVLADLLNEGMLSGIGSSAFRIEGDVTNNGQLSDMTAPDVTVTVSDTQISFKTAPSNTFDYFFRTEKAFRILAFDTDSRVRSLEYFIGAYDLSSLDGVMWQTCGEILVFAPDSVGIYRIYLRLTDTAGNVCVLSSPALVWYEDNISHDASLSYLKHTKHDAVVTLNTLESTLFSPLQTITCVSKDGKTTVTVGGAYLETLDEGSHIVELIQCPFGKTYVEGAINDPPAKLRLAVSVEYYVPVKGAHYTVDQPNENGWCNRDFSVYAKEGYLLSLDVDGVWTDRLTATEETESGVLRFYVKDTAGGAISRVLTEAYKLDKTAPAVHGVAIGATYYTTQCYIVTDVNSEMQSITVRGDRNLLHKQIFCDPAGNTLTVWFEIKPIAALAAPLSGLCDAYIKSTDAERVMQVLQPVSVQDRTHATAEEILQLDAIISDCKTLLAVIEATQAELERLTDAVASFDAADVKSSDAEMLQKLQSDMETLLRGTHLTADERAALRDCRITVASLMGAIARTQARISDVLRTFATYDMETVTADDLADLEHLQATSAALLDTDRLTDAEKADLREVASGIACLLGRIAETEARIEALCAAVSEYALDTVTSADRDRLSNLLAELDAGLGVKGLTDGQRYRLECMRAAVLGCLSAINNTVQKQAVLLDTLEKYRADAVNTDDRAALTDWRASAVLLLAEPNLTAGEKEALRASVATCDLLLERIDAAKTQREEIEALARAYFSRSVLTSDVADLQELTAELDTVLNGDHLTDRERGGLTLLRAELCDLIAIAEQARDMIATDAIQMAAALTAQSVTSADQVLLRQALAELTAALELCGAHYTEDELIWINAELRECRALLALLQSKKTDISYDRTETEPDDVRPPMSDPEPTAQRGPWVWVGVMAVCLLLLGIGVADAVLLRGYRRKKIED